MPSASLPRRNHSEAVAHAGDFLQPAVPVLPVAPPCFRFSFTTLFTLQFPCPHWLAVPLAHLLLSPQPTTSSSVAHGSTLMPRDPCPAVRCPSSGPGMGMWPVLNLREPPPPLLPSIPWMRTGPKLRSSVLKVATQWSPESPLGSELPLLGASPG